MAGVFDSARLIAVFAGSSRGKSAELEHSETLDSSCWPWRT